MAEQHRLRDDDRLRRDDPDPGAIADGDTALEQEPPNVTEADPPPRPGSAPDPAAAETSALAVDAADDADADAGAADNRAAVREAASVESVQRELAGLNDRHLRLVAEFDNYRKRVERERADVYRRAQADLAARLLDALDDLERVTHHADTSSADALLEGVQLVERKLRQALQAAGLETVEAEGARFDPNSMEAVAMTAAESHDEDEIVSDVFQRGYRFKGTLIRPARVRVKKHGA